MGLFNTKCRLSSETGALFCDLLMRAGRLRRNGGYFFSAGCTVQDPSTEVPNADIAKPFGDPLLQIIRFKSITEILGWRCPRMFSEEDLVPGIIECCARVFFFSPDVALGDGGGIADEK